jgi:DNA replication protein DnaD
MIRNKNISELAEILKRYITDMNLTLDCIDGFYLNQFTKRYMLHILARMTYYIEEQSGINSNFANYVNREQKNPYDIEHIWADDYTQGNHQNDFFTEEEFRQFRNMFGGLLILPKDKNRSFKTWNTVRK